MKAVHLKAVSTIIAVEKTIQREYDSLFECEFFVALAYSQCIRSSTIDSSYLLHMCAGRFLLSHFLNPEV